MLPGAQVLPGPEMLPRPPLPRPSLLRSEVLPGPEVHDLLRFVLQAQPA
jgi:hypothetical protein